MKAFAWPQASDSVGSVCSALDFLIAAENPSAVRRVPVEPEHGPELPLEIRVGRDPKPLASVSFQVVRTPYPAGAAPRDASLLRHGADRPAGLAGYGPKIGRNLLGFVEILPSEPNGETI